MNEASERYDDLAGLATAQLSIDWYPLAGVNSRYHKADRLLVLRDGLPSPEARLAIATAVAECELDQLNNAANGDAARLALTRLIPLDALAERLAVRHGGITAVAADLGVPSTAIRARLLDLDHTRAAALARRIRDVRHARGLPDCDPLRRLYTAAAPC